MFSKALTIADFLRKTQKGTNCVNFHQTHFLFPSEINCVNYVFALRILKFLKFKFIVLILIQMSKSEFPLLFFFSLKFTQQIFFHEIFSSQMFQDKMRKRNRGEEKMTAIYFVNPRFFMILLSECFACHFKGDNCCRKCQIRSQPSTAKYRTLAFPNVLYSHSRPDGSKSLSFVFALPHRRKFLSMVTIRSIRRNYTRVAN